MNHNFAKELFFLKIRAVFLILVFLIGLSLLSSCAGGLQNSSDSLGAYKIVDALSREIFFLTPPSRIVVAGKASFMILDALYLFPGAGDKLIAYSGGGLNDPLPFLSLIDPKMKEKQVLEYEVGPEQIAALKPDLVLMKSYLREKSGAPLERLGIKVCYLDLETPESFLRDIGILGGVFNAPERAEEIKGFYQTRLDSLKRYLENVSDRPSVLLAQYSEKGGSYSLSVPPSSWIQTSMVSLAGGRPVWASGESGGGFTVVNLEQVLFWDPEVCILISYGKDSGDLVEKLKSDPGWGQMKAVKNGRIYGFPADFLSWDQPDPRWILGLEWMARILHPGTFQAEMKEEIKNFFGELYGMSEKQVEETIFPVLKGSLD
ncbi:MAG: ABC transporter substrate-binding protein [Caldisericota bacterium]|nr:ABC transporter substrate-binding protein [Caldisericota bacterium]